MAEQEARDFNGTFVRMCYDQNTTEEIKDKYFETTGAMYLKKFETFLEKTKFLSGDQMTHADVYLFDLLDQMLAVYPSLLKGFNRLSEFYKTFDEMEQVKAFRKDERFVERPLNNPLSNAKIK
jgi:glutathionyl-hydroquinone reductase